MAAGLLLAGCQSTQDLSAQRGREGERTLRAEKGVKVGVRNTTVKVLGTEVVRDDTGTAVIVRVRNEGKAQAGVPLALAVRGGGQKILYRNDAPGLEPALTQLTAVGAGREEVWVNNQIPSLAATGAEAALGPAKATPSTVTGMRVSKVRVGSDDLDGSFAKGFVRNPTKVVQPRLTIFCVARMGGKAVAAGRAVIERLPPGKPVRFTLYFIGDPRGAKLDFSAPPTSIEGA